MASGFIILEDGRCWSRRWTGYDFIFELICRELDSDYSGFKDYLESVIPQKDDIEMGWGFIRNSTKETVVRNFDIREIAPNNRKLFWQAAQNAFKKLCLRKQNNEWIYIELRRLLKMHKYISKGESPEKLTDCKVIYPMTGIRIGPGW